MTDHTIRKGDLVRITCKGTLRTGVATSADGDPGSYNIELSDPVYGYTYWKQAVDTGNVELLQTADKLGKSIYNEYAMFDMNNLAAVTLDRTLTAALRRYFDMAALLQVNVREAVMLAVDSAVVMGAGRALTYAVHKRKAEREKG